MTQPIEFASQNDKQAMASFSELLVEHANMATDLGSLVSYGDQQLRDQAQAALVCNARTVSKMLQYMLTPPSFSWFFARSALNDADGAAIPGCEVWSIHT